MEFPRAPKWLYLILDNSIVIPLVKGAAFAKFNSVVATRDQSFRACHIGCSQDTDEKFKNERKSPPPLRYQRFLLRAK